MFRDYVRLLPQYRGVPDLRGVACSRAFFGFVPNWWPPRVMCLGQAEGLGPGIRGVQP